MRNKIIFTSILSSMVLGLGAQNKAPKSFDKYYDWFNKDIKADKANGVSVNKAYSELLAGKKPKKTIIVAVVDGGVDPDHEDLKANMWINEDEIPNNGIDDDNNGYIDDIHGWNFLGNAKGENIDAENLESTRWYRELRKTYADLDPENVTNQKEYALYKELDSIYWKNRNEYKEEFTQVGQMKFGVDFIFNALSTSEGKEIKTIDEALKIESEDKQTMEFVAALKELKQAGMTRKDIADYYEQSEKFYKNYYNLNFEARKDIIGDDLTDINDKNYGNPDIEGPDAFHGSFCAGIIGGVRDNNVGIQGVASAVKIMGVRAVPNGDEYDKDIALAIRYAVDNGAQVINMSFGKGYSPQKQLVDEAIEYANSKGVLLVHAAGNDSKNVDENDNFPDDVLNSGVTAPNVVTVGASSIYKNKKMLGVFSNYGKEKVDLFAPGVDVVSTAPDDYYQQSDGTSFAAPVVSGVAALVWSYYPELTHLELKNILLESTKNYKRKRVYIPSRDKKRKKRMRDLSVSGGVVNAYNALKLAEKKTMVYLLNK